MRRAVNGLHLQPEALDKNSIPILTRILGQAKWIQSAVSPLQAGEIRYWFLLLCDAWLGCFVRTMVGDESWETRLQIAQKMMTMTMTIAEKKGGRMNWKESVRSEFPQNRQVGTMNVRESWKKRHAHTVGSLSTESQALTVKEHGQEVIFLRMMHKLRESYRREKSEFVNSTGLIEKDVLTIPISRRKQALNLAYWSGQEFLHLYSILLSDSMRTLEIHLQWIQRNPQGWNDKHENDQIDIPSLPHWCCRSWNLVWPETQAVCRFVWGIGLSNCHMPFLLNTIKVSLLTSCFSSMSWLHAVSCCTLTRSCRWISIL